MGEGSLKPHGLLPFSEGTRASTKESTMQKLLSVSAFALGLASIGCSGEGASFPSYVAAARETTPVVTSGPSSTGTRAFRLQNLGYTSGWETAQSKVVGGRLPEILGDPSGPVPVTNIYELIEELDGIASDLGKHFDKDTNATRGCDVIAEDKVLKVPFFDRAGAAPFFDFTVAAGDFRCALIEDNRRVVFGRKPLASTPAGCSDAYTYNIISAEYFAGDVSAEDQARSAFRGKKNAVTMVIRGSYTPCTGELKMAYAQGSGYDGGALFSSRSDIVGNRITHDFRFRVLIWDREDPAQGIHKFRIRGAGRSRGVGNSFILSAEDSTGSKAAFCLSPKDAPGQFGDGKCADELEGAYGSIAEYTFEDKELPVFADPRTSLQPLFPTDSSAFGL